MKNMKKWWICCLMALLVLCATGTALAADGMIFRDCAICGTTTQFVRVRYGGNYYINNVPSHVGYYRCSLGHGDEIAYLDDHVPHSGGTATCAEQAKCEVCGTPYGALLPHNLGEVQEGKDPTCAAVGWEPYQKCKDCDYTTYREIPKLDHDLEHHEAKEPTCTTKGWEAFDTCKDCNYTTYEEIKPLGHWYSEWTPAANGTHTATCLRGCGHTASVACETSLLSGDLTFCPVCGEISNGAMLARVSATATSARTMRGEPTVRTGTLDNGETVLTIAFEAAGKLIKTNREVRVTLPASVLCGGTLCLLNADGTEVPLTVTAQGENIVLTLNFKNAPLFILHVHPAA